MTPNDPKINRMDVDVDKAKFCGIVLTIFLLSKGVSFGEANKAVVFCEDHFAVPSDFSFCRL